MKAHCMRIEFDSLPENEAFARVVVSAFLVRLNPTLEEITDVKTAVSEAVTNAIVHAYPQGIKGTIVLTARIEGRRIEITIADTGVGIADIPRAMEPFYTTQPELERSGMGFAVMRSFMDSLKVTSKPGQGTHVTLSKSFAEI